MRTGAKPDIKADDSWLSRSEDAVDIKIIPDGAADVRVGGETKIKVG